MDQKVIEVDGGLICPKHNKYIKFVILDNSISFSECLNCSLCFQEKITYSNKVISLTQIRTIIKHNQLRMDPLQENNKKLLVEVQILKEKIISFLQNVNQQFNDELLEVIDQWIIHIKDIQQRGEAVNLLKEIEILHQNNGMPSCESDKLKENNQKNFNKLISLFEKFSNNELSEACHQLLEKIKIIILKEEVKLEQQAVKKKVIRFQIIQNITQKEDCCAIVFNQSGEIMVTGFLSQIIIWKFDEGRFKELLKLSGHHQDVSCFAFSKKQNWFASGSWDKTIRCWKQMENENWNSSEPQEQHSDQIMCILLNKNEDQLISSGLDGIVNIWKATIENNLLEFCYILDQKHTGPVYSIGLNGSETSLITCCKDKKIILWVRGNNQLWQYQNEILNDDYGYRICFLNDNEFIWQQQEKGVSHIFVIENGQIIRKSEQEILLDFLTTDERFFPTIWNRNCEILIQKHSSFLYLLAKQNENKFTRKLEIINCRDPRISGALTDNGEYLVVWSFGLEGYRVHKLIIE